VDHYIRTYMYYLVTVVQAHFKPTSKYCYREKGNDVKG